MILKSRSSICKAGVMKFKVLFTIVYHFHFPNCILKILSNISITIFRWNSNDIQVDNNNDLSHKRDRGVILLACLSSR